MRLRSRDQEVRETSGLRARARARTAGDAAPHLQAGISRAAHLYTLARLVLGNARVGLLGRQITIIVPSRARACTALRRQCGDIAGDDNRGPAPEQCPWAVRSCRAAARPPSSRDQAGQHGGQRPAGQFAQVAVPRVTGGAPPFGR